MHTRRFAVYPARSAAEWAFSFVDREAARSPELGRHRSTSAQRGSGVVKITLPYPPSGNHRLAHGRGRYYRTAAYRQFIAAVTAIVRKAGVRCISDGRLRLELVFFPDTRRVADLDNLIKSTADSIVEAGWVRDDSMFDYVAAGRVWGTKRGEVEVEIKQLQ